MRRNTKAKSKARRVNLGKLAMRWMNEGMAKKAIARKLNVNDMTIHRWVEEARRAEQAEQLSQLGSLAPSKLPEDPEPGVG